MARAYAGPDAPSDLVRRGWELSAGDKRRTSGIKIESLAASGLDDQGEYIWRQLAEATLGQFIFLTYGADDTTTHHANGYTANNLDDLVVRLVDSELRPAATSSTEQQATPSPTTSPTGGQ